MKVLIEAKEETEVLHSVDEQATAEEIVEAIEERAESCVDHLCGCND